MQDLGAKSVEELQHQLHAGQLRFELRSAASREKTAPGRGDDTLGIRVDHRAQISQFEATVSQSTVPSPPIKPLSACSLAHYPAVG